MLEDSNDGGIKRQRYQASEGSNVRDIKRRRYQTYVISIVGVTNDGRSNVGYPSIKGGFCNIFNTNTGQKFKPSRGNMAPPIVVHSEVEGSRERERFGSTWLILTAKVLKYSIEGPPLLYVYIEQLFS